MRAVAHAKEEAVDDVFRALADPSRRALLDALFARNGQTLSELTAGMAMTRQAVTKHLAVLENANLVATVRRGREKLHYPPRCPFMRSANAGSPSTSARALRR